MAVQLRKGITVYKAIYAGRRYAVATLYLPKGTWVRFAPNSRRRFFYEKCRANRATVRRIDLGHTANVRYFYRHDVDSRRKLATQKKRTRAKGYAAFDPSFKYRVGKKLVVEDFCHDRTRICAEGIHFFYDRRAAEEYNP